MENQQQQLLETDLSKNPSIRRLQYVLDVILREEYENILVKRDEIYDKVSQHVQLQKLIRDDLKLTSSRNQNDNNDNNNDDSEGEQRTVLHDVGCNMFVQAKLLEPKKVIHVNIGCGVIVAMTIDEALKFSKKAEDTYRMRGEKLTRDSLNAKYKMRLVMEAIMRLQDIQIEKDVSKKK